LWRDILYRNLYKLSLAIPISWKVFSGTNTLAYFAGKKLERKSVDPFGSRSSSGIMEALLVSAAEHSGEELTR
jgi:hypothetical protein